MVLLAFPAPTRETKRESQCHRRTVDQMSSPGFFFILDFFSKKRESQYRRRPDQISSPGFFFILGFFFGLTLSAISSRSVS